MGKTDGENTNENSNPLESFSRHSKNLLKTEEEIIGKVEELETQVFFAPENTRAVLNLTANLIRQKAQLNKENELVVSNLTSYIDELKGRHDSSLNSKIEELTVLLDRLKNS